MNTWNSVMDFMQETINNFAGYNFRQLLLIKNFNWRIKVRIGSESLGITSAIKNPGVIQYEEEF